MRESFLTCILSQVHFDFGTEAAWQRYDVYFKPLVDDLMKLWTVGVKIWNQYDQEYFMLHGLLLYTVIDLLGGHNLSGQSKGEKECPQCGDDITCVYLKKIKEKCVHVGPMFASQV